MTTVVILIIAMMITITPAVAPISLEQLRRMPMPCNEQKSSLSIIITHGIAVNLAIYVLFSTARNLPTVTLTSSLEN